MDLDALKKVAGALSGALTSAAEADAKATTFDPSQPGNLFADIGPDQAFKDFRILASPARMVQAKEVSAAIDKAIAEGDEKKLQRIAQVLNTIIPGLRTVGVL